MRRQDGKLHTPAGEKRIPAYEESIRLLPRKRCEGRIDLVAGGGLQDPDLQSHGASSRFYIPQCGLRRRRIGWIDEHCHARRSRHQLTQEFQPLRRQLTAEEINPCQVAARLGEAGDKTEPDRVFGRDEDNRDRRGCRLGGQRRRTICGSDHRDPTGHQFAGHRRKPIDLVLGKAIGDRHVLALDIAGRFQALAKPAQTVRERVRRSGVEKPDDRHRLLRARRARPKT
jgi:hypothetical protein